MGTLLEIVQGACDEIGVTSPTIVVGSTDQTIRTLLSMSNREGREIARAAAWTVLQRTYTFTTVNGQAEYDLPSDYSRLIYDTEWDRSQRRPLIGPVSPQRWQELKSGLLGSGLAGKRYRIERASSGTGRKIYVDPTPGTSGETLAFEYISDQWCVNAAGNTLANAWAADTDIALVNQDLMTLGLIVRFKRSKGFAFGSEADEYAQMFATLVGQDRPAPSLNLAARRGLHLLDYCNVPETGYGE